MINNFFLCVYVNLYALFEMVSQEDASFQKTELY